MLHPGLYPFWFWNDRLEEGELRRQIAEMAAQGFRGFYIHSRQGLGVPYLSDAFMDLVAVTIDAAEAHDMTVHLYDEYPYPSGVAGGMVGLGDPEFRATRLDQKSYDVNGGGVRLELPMGKVLACTAYRVKGKAIDWESELDVSSGIGPQLQDESYMEAGLTVYNRKRYFASDPRMILETSLPSGTWKVLVSVQQVVDDHKYWGHFVDVLNPEAIARWIELTHERYFARFGDKFGTTIPSIFVDETCPHWSSCLPDLYESQWGESAISVLPALQEPSHPRHKEVAKRFFDLKLDRFVETFETPLRDWCRAHGIRYAGEKPSLRLSQLEYMDLPGCDPGHTKAGAEPDVAEPKHRSNARAIASAAYWYGKEGALCECYHSMGWSGTLQDAKLVAELLVQAGVRYLVPHGAFYSTHSLRKHDAPPSFFVQMPYWSFFHHLSARLDKLFGYFENTYIDAQVLVIDPHPGLATVDNQASLKRLYRCLHSAHLDYLVVDVDMLQQAEMHGDSLSIKDLSVQAVVVPPSLVVEPALAEWLEDYQAAGGRILEWRDDSDVASLLSIAAPHLRVTLLEGKVDPLWVVTRTQGDQTFWLVINPSNDAVVVRFKAEKNIAEVALGDTPVALQADGMRCVAPHESFLLASHMGANSTANLPVIELNLQQEMAVETLDPNRARLGEWRLSLPAYSTQSAPVQCVPLANQLEASGLPYAPALSKDFGVMPKLTFPVLDVCYQTEIEVDVDAVVALHMEKDTFVGDWAVIFNGKHRITETDFAVVDVEGTLGCEVADFLEAGVNSIKVELTTDRLDGGLRNPLYLVGDFGVELSPMRLTAPQTTGRFEAYAGNRLPFFSGTIEYSYETQLEPGKGEHLVRLALPPTCQEACEISFNGSAWHPILWSPHHAVVPASELLAGSNQVRIRVHTSLVRAYEGEWFDPVAHRYRKVGELEN